MKWSYVYIIQNILSEVGLRWEIPSPKNPGDKRRHTLRMGIGDIPGIQKYPPPGLGISGYFWLKNFWEFSGIFGGFFTGNFLGSYIPDPQDGDPQRIPSQSHLWCTIQLTNSWELKKRFYSPEKIIKQELS